MNSKYQDFEPGHYLFATYGYVDWAGGNIYNYIGYDNLTGGQLVKNIYDKVATTQDGTLLCSSVFIIDFTDNNNSIRCRDDGFSVAIKLD